MSDLPADPEQTETPQHLDEHHDIQVDQDPLADSDLDIDSDRSAEDSNYNDPYDFHAERPAFGDYGGNPHRGFAIRDHVYNKNGVALTMLFELPPVLEAAVAATRAGRICTLVIPFFVIRDDARSCCQGWGDGCGNSS